MELIQAYKIKNLEIDIITEDMKSKKNIYIRIASKKDEEKFLKIIETGLIGRRLFYSLYDIHNTNTMYRIHDNIISGANMDSYRNRRKYRDKKDSSFYIYINKELIKIETFNELYEYHII